MQYQFSKVMWEGLGWLCRFIQEPAGVQNTLIRPDSFDSTALKEVEELLFYTFPREEALK